MGVYSKYVLPRMINYACGMKPTRKQREKVLPLAEGLVLEIGIGTGLNLPFYDQDKVSEVVGIDPEDANWKLNKYNGPITIDFRAMSAEQMDLESNTFDSVVCTYTLCTIPNADLALEEIQRVLKPSGKFIFSEHGLAPDHKTSRIQHKLNPYWKKISGGCNLNRNIETVIEDAGLAFDSIEQMFIPGWKPVSYNYWGVASKR